ncbi:MAG: flippase-like domain-containing protein [Ichthyobacteriaceae bacterium]|nr:flippase-like domain-containing protein [Ichthyobacteriaceae bacterium]
MNKKLLSTLKYSIFIILGIVLIYLVFKDTDIDKMISDLEHADYRYVILSFVLGYLAYVSRALRWVILLEPMGYKPKAINAINSVAITYFTNLALPRAGEITRATTLSKTENIPVEKLLGTILLERVIDFIFLFGILAATFILRFDDFVEFINIVLNSNAETTANSDSNILIYFFAIIAVSFGTAFLLRNKIKKTNIYFKIREFVKGLIEGVKTIKHLKKKWLFVAHSVFIWVMYYLMVYVVFFAMPETSNLTMSDGLFLMAVGALGMVAPVPGGLGAYHGAVIIGISLIGLSVDTGRSFAIIVHTTQSLIALIFGTIAVVMISFAKKKNSTDK